MSVEYSKHAVVFQVYGGESLSSHTWLTAAWAPTRMLFLADKTDEEHLETVKQLELKKHL